MRTDKSIFEAVKEYQLILDRRGLIDNNNVDNDYEEAVTLGEMSECIVDEEKKIKYVRKINKKLLKSQTKGRQTLMFFV